MKTLKKVEIEPLFVEFIPELLEQNKFYISEKYKTATHICLCGCGKKVITPLITPQFWNMKKENNGTISLTPSVGNYNLPCKSHYIITKNVANFC